MIIYLRLGSKLFNITNIIQITNKEGNECKLQAGKALSSRPPLCSLPISHLSILLQQKEKTKNFLANTSRSVMAKKFKINDGGSKYVEQATLLEPANNSASNQNELDEIREISFQLAQIKKKHDEAKKMGNLKQDELEMVRKEIDQLYMQET